MLTVQRPKRSRRRQPKPKSIYDLIDWHCPSYRETKPGSTEYGAAILNIFGLLDGRYVWQTAYTRAKFADGAEADWFIGNSPASGEHAHVVGSFGEAISLARVELQSIPLPRWAN